MRCLDVGCGAGDVSLFLASLVGPSGAVMGIDSDGVQLDLVRAECHRLGVTNVELVLQDVMRLEVHDAYDVVYSRFVLEHLPDPLEALRRMWLAVRPGGLLIAEDGDFLAEFCEPPHPGFDFWQYAYQETLRRHGGDPLSGRRLHSRFRGGGHPRSSARRRPARLPQRGGQADALSDDRADGVEDHRQRSRHPC